MMRKIVCTSGLMLMLGAATVQAQYTNLHAFAGGVGDGASPKGSVTLSGTTLYGLTSAGGAGAKGILFKMNADGSGYTTLHAFAGGPTDGAVPYYSDVTLSGSTLYGLTTAGGANHGVIYMINTDGSGYTNLHTFAGDANDGSEPYGSLTLSGTTLYGLTTFGGSNSNKGVIFRLNTDGSGYTNLHSFAGGVDDGQWPYGSLTLSGTALYGMTLYGGSNSAGVIFKINTDGSGYAQLHTFTGGAGDGAYPYGGLTLSGTTLNGMTSQGGSNGMGVIFKIKTDGSGYTNLHSFVSGTNDGHAPYGALTLSGTMLCGMTTKGGPTANGVLFKINSDGSGYTNLHLFAGGANDGAAPYGAVAMAESTMYGLTYSGGAANLGTVFALLLSTVSGSASPSNSGYVTGGGLFALDATVQLTATGSNGWLFTSWADGSTNNPYTVTVPATNINYTALFAPAVTITLAVNTNAGGTAVGGGAFFVGSNALLTATASNGWQFLQWNDGVPDTTRTVVAVSNRTYTAIFAPTAGLTVQANPVAGGYVTGGGAYVVGSNALLTATASNLWRFTSWNDLNTNSSRTVTMPPGGATYTANFRPLDMVLVVADPTNGGSVAGGGLYIVSSNATVTATASNGWRFMTWNGSITNNPWTFTVTPGATVCTANFAKLSVITVAVTPTNGGTVGGGGIYIVGNPCTLSAVPQNGWAFSQWNDGNSANPRLLTVPPTNVTYTASFAVSPASLALGRAVGAPSLFWQPGGDAVWAAASDGLSAQSGAVAGGQQSWLQVVTNGPASLVFSWKLSAELSDALQFSVNGQVQAQLTTRADWQQYAVFLGSTNSYILRWTFVKHAFSAAGGNAGSLAHVNWMPCPYAEHVPQVYYQDPSGMLASWVLSSTGGFQFARILAITGGWALKTAGDVDCDGVSDLLFESADGGTAGWLMNADGSVRDMRAWSNIKGWEIKACGDYEGTHRGQVFFQNALGDVAYWRLNTNGTYQSSASLGNQGGWKLRGAGDLDGDGKAELFWQNAAGTVVIWFHNPDGSIRGGTPFNTANWALCGVADIDGDTISDLVWQNTPGDTGGWFMNSNGTARAASYWWNTGAWKLKGAGR